MPRKTPPAPFYSTEEDGEVKSIPVPDQLEDALEILIEEIA